jgi:hypothetical protein
MFAETSSKENTGIKELFIKLAKKLCFQYFNVCLPYPNNIFSKKHHQKE